MRRSGESGPVAVTGKTQVARTYSGGYAGKRLVTVFPRPVVLLLAVRNNKQEARNNWDLEPFPPDIPNQSGGIMFEEHFVPSATRKMSAIDLV